MRERGRKREREPMCVSMCERERKRECVCEYVRERDIGWVKESPAPPTKKTVVVN